MKAKELEFSILKLILVVAFFTTNAMAQSSCTSVLISLSPCLNYITGNSSSTPSSGCCTQLASVVGSQPKCLCEVINNSSSLGISINQTQALTLPIACNVQTPPASRCTASSPAASPGGNPGGGSKNVPSTKGDSSDGTSIKIPFSILLVLVIVAPYGSPVINHLVLFQH